MKLTRKRGVWVGIGGILLIGGALFLWKTTGMKAKRSDSKIRQEARSDVQAGRVRPWEAPISNPMSLEEANSEIRKIIENIVQLIEIKNKNTTDRKNNPKTNSEKLSQNEEALSSAQFDLRRALDISPEARSQTVAAVLGSKDSAVKRELSRAFLTIAPEKRAESIQTLLGSADSSDRRQGVRLLSDEADSKAVATFLRLAEKDPEPGVRKDAILGLGKVAASGGADEGVRETGRQAIRKFTAQTYEPMVRQTAYRAFAMRSDWSPEDRKLIVGALDTEKDPSVKSLVAALNSLLKSREAEPTRGVRGSALSPENRPPTKDHRKP